VCRFAPSNDSYVLPRSSSVAGRGFATEVYVGARRIWSEETCAELCAFSDNIEIVFALYVMILIEMCVRAAHLGVNFLGVRFRVLSAWVSVLEWSGEVRALSQIERVYRVLHSGSVSSRRVASPS